MTNQHNEAQPIKVNPEALDAIQAFKNRVGSVQANGRMLLCKKLPVDALKDQVKMLHRLKMQARKARNDYIYNQGDKRAPIIIANLSRKHPRWGRLSPASYVATDATNK